MPFVLFLIRDYVLVKYRLDIALFEKVAQNLKVIMNGLNGPLKNRKTKYKFIGKETKIYKRIY